MTNINTESTAPQPINAEAFASIASNGLEASIRLKKPMNGGAELSYEMLKIFLLKNKIVTGIDDETLRLLGKQPIYDTDMIIARGTPIENGMDAQLIYHIETNQQLRPKEKEDGSVDFKDLGAIQEVKQGDLLCEKIAATPGQPGQNVSGGTLPCVAGKDLLLPGGQNTVVSEDKLKLYAGLDGHVSVIGGKISVLNVFTVAGDVSVGSGNIDFSGNVVVRGDVASGFSVRADGDVTINGVVESASITVGGTLIIKGGFLGGDNGKLEVGGNAICKFIESGEVMVRGDLETTYIMNATVKCSGAVNLTGRGLIRGGYVSARTSVTANTIGSAKSSSASTTIEIGNDPTLAQRYETLKSEVEETAKNISNLEAMIGPMEKAKSTGYLTLDKINQLEKAKLLLENLRPNYETMQESLATLEGHVARLGRGTVNARRTAHAGLKLVIGSDTTIIQSDHDRVSFFKGNEGITFVPLMNEFA